VHTLPPVSAMSWHSIVMRGSGKAQRAARHLGVSLLCGWFCLPWPLAAASFWSENSTASEAFPALQQFNASLVKLTQQLLPAVVSLKVRTKSGEVALPKNHPLLLDDEMPGVTGSGFIIRADGLVLTNHHVVEESTSIDVRLYGGETTTATVLGRDPLGDVALLQLATTRALPVIPLGSSTAVQVGELVLAVGSPFGFEHTITLGIVSGKQRHFLRSGLVGGYLQTDAPLTTGNSGGPLVTMRGEVVGINTAVVGRGEVGLAIPIDAVKALLPQLHATGQVTRGWLGVHIRPLDRTKARSLGLETARGVYVYEVMPDQPAHQAGIVVGDVIVSFDGKTIVHPADLQGAVASTPVGKKVRVELLRARTKQTVEVGLGVMPERKE
jgi:serine protease Do